VTYFIGVAGCMICLLEKSSTTKTVIKFLSQNLLCWVVVIMSGLRSLWFLLLHLILCCHQEGVTKLWTGLGPNVARNAIINAAELASYDQVKQTLLKLPGFSDNVVTHLLSGLGAGFIAVCVGSPVDVVKSRMMGSSSTAYKGTVDCFVQTLKNDVHLPLPHLCFFPSTSLLCFDMAEKSYLR
jgi:hypothetical protein